MEIIKEKQYLIKISHLKKVNFKDLKYMQSTIYITCEGLPSLCGYASQF